MARIFIIGSGVVGAATGLGFARAGHQVTFIDISADRLAALAAQGLDARAGLDLAAEPESFIFLTLPTPNVGNYYDLRPFGLAVAELGRALARATAMHTVVVRSTVPPGTTQQVVAPLLEQHSGRREDVGFCLASNPESLRAASGEDDFRWPWMTVIGARNARVRERLGGLLSPLGGELRVFDDPRIAEFVKCAHNFYNATKISFWNEMWLVCQELGIDHDTVADTVADSAEGSLNRYYGIRRGGPYGGVCPPKDTKGFLGFAAGLGVPMPLLQAVIEINEIPHAPRRRDRTHPDPASDLPGQPCRVSVCADHGSR